MKHLLALAIGLTALATSALAAKDESAFEKLKSLAGTWKGDAQVGDSKVPTTVKYRVVSGGSAVEETIMPDDPHAMVTMYYMDGKSLVMTHYCHFGNQPRMKLAAASSSSTLQFDFAGGSNIKPGAPYMHSLTMKVLAPDHIQAQWFAQTGDKPMMHIDMDLRKSGD